MELTPHQLEKIEQGKVDFSNAIIYFLMVHSDLLAYATKINLEVIKESSSVLKNRVKDIKNISSEIAQISFKSQMLSINASIEAARIGENGKGFAVVATEVGKLSEQTKQSMAKVEKVNHSTYQQAVETENEIEHVGSVLQRFSDSNQELADIMKDRLKINSEDYIISMLALRLVNHADFIVNIMKNAGKLTQVANHHECAMGKWYDTNKSKYSRIKEYTDVDSIHEEFHSVAKQYNETLEIEYILKMVEVSHKILVAFLSLVDAFEKIVMKNPEEYIPL